MRRSTTPSSAALPDFQASEANPLDGLEARVASLEKLVQGLQDSIYREAQRQEKRLTELEARIEPATLAAALSKDARERGL
jgi:hypothetical protein